jgi:hypothetical protein
MLQLAITDENQVLGRKEDLLTWFGAWQLTAPTMYSIVAWAIITFLHQHRPFDLHLAT